MYGIMCEKKLLVVARKFNDVFFASMLPEWEMCNVKILLIISDVKLAEQFPLQTLFDNVISINPPVDSSYKGVIKTLFDVFKVDDLKCNVLTLSNPILVVNQYIVKKSQCEKLVLIEDGLMNYYEFESSKSNVKKIFQLMLGINESKFLKQIYATYLFSPEFAKYCFGKNNRLIINSKYFDNLLDVVPDLNGKKIFVDQCLYRYGYFSIEEYNIIINRIIEKFQIDYYLPHPFSLMKETINCDILDLNSNHVTLECCAARFNFSVYAFNSTVLFSTKLINPQIISTSVIPLQYESKFTMPEILTNCCDHKVVIDLSVSKDTKKITQVILPVLRFAYLLLAHTDPELLQNLIDLLDDIRNDIYVHIDAKSDISKFSAIKSKYSRITVLEKRIDVGWGAPSQIDLEYLLFNTALCSGIEYYYFHLLSGQDLPLKSQDEIHLFFNNNNGFEFINFESNNATSDEIDRKCKLYHILLSYVRHKNLIVCNIVNLIRKSLLGIQYYLGFRRNFRWKQLKKGSNWCSVTYDFVKYLIENEKLVKQEFRMTHCSDEIYKQTLAYNSPVFKSRIYPYGNMRLIDFKRGSKQSPYTFRQNNFAELINSNALFARKFSSFIDSDIINSIKTFLNRK